MTMKRFRIEEISMLPSLEPGAEIVATDSISPEVGDVVVFPHPERADFWLVKRAVSPPEPIAEDELWASSDNAEATRADSRTFGPVPKRTVLTQVTRLDAERFAEACMMLAAEDDDIRRAIDQHGIPEFWHRPQGFRVLVLLILEQQVSLESGAAMYRRLDTAGGDVTPETLLNLGDDGLRALGVTRQKSQYLLGLSDAVSSGTLDLSGLDELPPDEARNQLVALKGIGAWTADAYLLSALRHIDMWPVGDRALQVGAADVLGMKAPPTEAELEIIGEPWRPVRAAAARIIWHFYLTERGRVEPPDPTVAHAPARDA